MIFKFKEFHNIKLGDIIKLPHVNIQMSNIVEKTKNEFYYNYYNLWKVININREMKMDFINNKVDYSNSFVICENINTCSVFSEKRQFPLYDHDYLITITDDAEITKQIIGYDACEDDIPDPFAHKKWNNTNIHKAVKWRMEQQTKLLE